MDNSVGISAAPNTYAANGTGNPSQAFQPNNGAIARPDGRICIGRVGAPPRHEATSTKFYFWVPSNVVVERTQLIVCESEIAGQLYTYYALIDEVSRCSRQQGMGAEVDQSDGDLSYEPPFASDGYTYAEATILRTEPAVFTSPRERSDVLLATPDDATMAYAADEIEQSLPVGLIKNGGSHTAGPGFIDLDYLLGVNGGHMNVNGAAGRGTKSSFLLFCKWMLLEKARLEARERPSDPSRLRVVPIILNVKNFDLFFIDRKNKKFDEEKHSVTWNELEVDEPAPFQDVQFYAPQQRGGSCAIATGRNDSVFPYSWSLKDIIAEGLLMYLFADADTNDLNFSALVLDIESWLTDEQVDNDSSITRSLRSNTLEQTNFEGFLDWVGDQTGEKEEDRKLRSHHTATWRKLHRRLRRFVYESRGVLRYRDQEGNPLKVTRTDTSDPIVIDLAALASQPELQRFVVATIFRQLIDARMGTNAISGLVYLVTLDELNRFAPKGAKDPITQLIETVAAEMRSQGIILFGAQQQASKVSEKIIENSAIRVLGKSGSLELASTTWRFLSNSAREKASSLGPDEKLIIQDNFREPMHVRVPFPIWAMNPNEAESDHSDGDGDIAASFID